MYVHVYVHMQYILYSYICCYVPVIVSTAKLHLVCFVVWASGMGHWPVDSPAPATEFTLLK